ncbi:SRPBCC family protein [Roseibium litorale]|uniref:Carbon monoxide dehydrogenase subunit G n=1 Tax=Roseibium litorale TaxID=2803841 RepID=A0ABR9CNE0_9HYPH|nr:carbon monoxide dehydrogenase subunit G [Roseibium litorale]MBD8892366.1 carbon monoxide dehydrogenase subunit G [Roseibium litorale]
MEMTGKYTIPASREAVWQALNDPAILKQCIPGCDELEMTSPTEMTAQVTSKIGPVKAKFKGEVTLQNINPPESYTIAGEGKGGVAGFAKGGADVHLEESAEGTILTYTANAQVGGKLAQLGSRLIDSTARKMADEFFGKFSEVVGGGADGGDDGLDAGEIAAAQTAAVDEAPVLVSEAVTDIEHAVEEKIHDAEEKIEVAAGKGVLGGPFVWGLIALAALIAVLAVLN